MGSEMCIRDRPCFCLPAILLFLIQLLQSFRCLLEETLDESGPFDLLGGEVFHFLLVLMFVVVESVFDGQDVLVDGYSVIKKLDNN